MRVLSFLIIIVSLFFLSLSTDSPHGSNLKISCDVCHSSKGWYLDKEIYSFNHNTTQMPLVGQHTKVNCRLCHPTLVFSQAKTECNQCHNDVHQGSVGLDCSRCHTPVSWLVNNVNEIHLMSRFPLVGAHRTAECMQCHKSDNPVRFDVPGIFCIDCHRQDFMGTTNPNHTESGFSTDCALCHPINSTQWAGSGFSHDFFMLVQGHSIPKCYDCHISGRFTGASRECNSCHQQDYLATTNPNHDASNFSTNCQQCHTLNPGWKPANFDHTIFPLNLGHAAPACIDCHRDGNYTTTPTDCNACHQQDYMATLNPNHNASGFPTNCQQCHTLNPGWKPANFDHTSFPLTLGHGVPVCADCHIGGNYTNTPTNCYACHQQDFSATTNPNHIASNFATTCQDCHTTNPGWKPANFNHTAFPLTLGHAGPVCTDCHIGGNYTNTPTTCYSCHQQDYAATTNPNHGTAGFPTTCQDCHTTNPGWKPANFNHSAFPLTLGHAGPGCTDCHIGGNYTNTPTDCYACHQADYLATSNPNHQSLNFSTICTQCHTTNPGWKPASYLQHDSQFFPIYSGKHQGEWSSCSDCHDNLSNYSQFTCITCHHKPDMDESHNGVSGYSYTSSACYQCHPTGNSDKH